MPEMTGTEFLTAAQTIVPNLPAIIITGDPDAIPIKHKNFPVIEKGGLNFIKDLLSKVNSLGTYVGIADGLNVQITNKVLQRRTTKKNISSKNTKNSPNNIPISSHRSYKIYPNK